MAVNDESTINPDVSFTKDNSTDFNSSTDTVTGRIYFRKDGIYVDGYLYSYILPISSSNASEISSQANWTLKCFTLNISVGTYIIQVINGNDIYSGIFSYNASDNSDEIILHRSGTTNERIYLKAKSDGLYIASATNLTNLELTIKLRKFI